MRSVRSLQIPQVFSKEPDKLQRDLERLSAEVQRHGDNLGNVFARRIGIERSLIVSGTAKAFFESAIRLAPGEGQEINVYLPSPDKAKAGRVVPIIRTKTNGVVYVHAPGALVNGRKRIVLDSTLTVSSFLFDGENYYGDKQHGVTLEEDI